MRSVKVSLALLLTTLVATVQASSKAVLFIYATFTNPSCEIKVPVAYDLGTLNRGETKTHAPFYISWECGAIPVSTALTASVVTGKLQGQNQVEMVTGNQGSGSFLKLREKADNLFKDIKITGQKADAFCSATSNTTRRCELVPETEVRPNATSGQVYATLRFTVTYQ